MTDLNALRKAAEDQGWKIERTASNHLRWIPPDPKQTPVISGHTNSDWRAVRNTLARLRRRGLRMNGHEAQREELLVKETPPPAAVPAGMEEMFRCLDCGYDHPRAEMATNPDGRPTRYCKIHMNQRRSRGRVAQIARDRERAQDAAAPETLNGAHLHVVQNESPAEGTSEENMPDPEGLPASEPGLDLRELVRSEVEVLLSALSDLETRVDRRLGTLEQGLEQVHTQPLAADPGATAPRSITPPAPVPAPGAVDGTLAVLITTFAQHTLWLAEFEEADLSVKEKQLLIAKAAIRLAERLRAEDEA